MAMTSRSIRFSRQATSPLQLGCGRDFETLGLGGGSGGGSRVSRATMVETLAARDVGGTRCEFTRFDEKSHRVSTVAFRITGR